MHWIQVWGILESYLCTYKDRYATLFTQLSLAGNSHTSLSVVSADIRCLPIKKCAFTYHEMLSSDSNLDWCYMKRINLQSLNEQR